MLTEERYRHILHAVEQQGSATVQELTALLKTSESTIRRDLSVLHSKQRLIKVHGGATVMPASYDMMEKELEERLSLNQTEKADIGRCAAAQIEDEDFVYLDAGSTIGAILDYITAKNVVFVTNAATHAGRLAKRGFQVHLLGGEFRALTEAIIGAEAMEALSKYNFTKGFFGTNGISKTAHFTTPDISEALIKKEAFSRCQKCFVLGDATKFGRVSPVTFAKLPQAVIITDHLQDDSYRTITEILEVKKT